MELRKIKSIKQIRNIYKLYQNSFPKEEKKPFGLILIGALRENFEIFSIEKKKTDEKNRNLYEFKGLVITFWWNYEKENFRKYFLGGKII